MSRRVERTGGLLRALVHEVRTENLTFMAGSLAYHAFVSLLPLLLLVLAVVSTVGDATLEASLIDLAGRSLTPGAGELLTVELRQASASAGVSVAGGAFLLWGTLRIFRGLDIAFSVIYQSESRNTFSDQLVDGLVVLVALVLAVAAVVVVEAAVARALVGTAGWAVQRLVIFVGLTLAFLPMYYVFPDQPGMRVIEVLPGAVVATAGLTLLESFLGLYVAVNNTATRRSVIVAVLVLLTLLYLANLVVLLGAAVNVVTSNRTQEVNVRPLVAGLPETAPRALDRSELLATLERVEDRLDGGATLAIDDGSDGVTLSGPDVVAVDAGTPGPFTGDRPVRLECYWFPSGGDGDTDE
jgi:membrane protein